MNIREDIESVKEDIKLYKELSGEDGSQETIATIGAYLRGYRQGKEDAEPHWIPVTERLPEDDVFVLLTVRRMDDSYNHVPFISTGYISWNHQCWWCAHDGNCKDANVEVLAWMPLPEPYKGVTE